MNTDNRNTQKEVEEVFNKTVQGDWRCCVRIITVAGPPSSGKNKYHYQDH